MVFRICQMITELRPAGAERCVYDLATRLPRDRFAVEVLALRGGAVADDLRAAGVPVHVLNVCCKADITKLPRLIRTLRRGRYDLLHTHLFHADLAGRVTARRARIGHLVHSVHVAERRFRPWRYTWARWAARRCDRIICVSAGVRDDHAAHTRLSADHYAVIHNGVDAARFARDDTRRDAYRRRWSVADTDVVCAFVGRLDPQKGIDVLLDGFDRAAAGNARLHLVIAGDGPERKRVEQWLQACAAADRVHVLGHVDDVPGVLSAADIFCQPSRWEGFCLAAAEASAASLPVVGSDVAGLNEVVVNGDTGLLTTAGAVRPFAVNLIGLADDVDLRGRLGAAGCDRVTSQLTVERFIDRHAELYEHILA